MADHGTTARYAAGCHCRKCKRAHAARAADYRARLAAAKRDAVPLSAPRSEPARAAAVRSPGRAPGRAQGRAQSRAASPERYRVSIRCTSGIHEDTYYYVRDIRPGEVIACPQCGAPDEMPSAAILRKAGYTSPDKSALIIDGYFIDSEPDSAPVIQPHATRASAVKTARPVTAAERALISERNNLRAELESLYAELRAAEPFAYCIPNGPAVVAMYMRIVSEWLTRLRTFTPDDVNGSPSSAGTLPHFRNEVWNQRGTIKGYIRNITAQRKA